MSGGPQPFDAERERLRLQRRAELADLVMPLGREDRDPMNADSPYAANPWFDWTAWRASVPRSWDHGELRAHRHALILDDEPQTVIRTYNRFFATELQQVLEVVRPLMVAHRISVPFLYEVQTRVDLNAGLCCQRMQLGGQVVPNGIMLSSRVKPIGLLYNFLHELAHCIPEPTSDLDPGVNPLGHHVGMRKRHGMLLHELLETNTTLPPELLHRLRFIARDDEYSPPIHPLGWRWDEVPVKRR